MLEIRYSEGKINRAAPPQSTFRRRPTEPCRFVIIIKNKNDGWFRTAMCAGWRLRLPLKTTWPSYRQTSGGVPAKSGMIMRTLARFRELGCNWVNECILLHLWLSACPFTTFFKVFLLTVSYKLSSALSSTWHWVWKEQLMQGLQCTSFIVPYDFIPVLLISAVEHKKYIFFNHMLPF